MWVRTLALLLLVATLCSCVDKGLQPLYPGPLSEADKREVVEFLSQRTEKFELSEGQILVVPQHRAHLLAALAQKGIPHAVLPSASPSKPPEKPHHSWDSPTK